RIDRHFGRSLRYSVPQLRAEYHRIEQRTKPHTTTPLNEKWLELIERHAERWKERSDFHKTLAACCLWLRAYHSHQNGKPDEARSLLDRAESRFTKLLVRGRLDPIGFDPGSDIDNLRG